MPIKFESKGSFANTVRILKKLSNLEIRSILESYGQRGVAALSAATPVHSGLAARSWDYKIEKDRSGWTLTWINTDVENGFPVAIMIQHGHGTGTGGYVQGIDYINPAIRPLFEQFANDVWKVVKSA